MGLLDEMMVSPEEKTRAQYEGLLSMGLGILANNTSKNAAPALGRGGMIGMNQYKESMSDLRQQKVQDFMMKQKVAEYNRNQQRDAAIAQLREQIPEQMRPMFDMNPEGFIAQMNKPEEEYTLSPGSSRFRGGQQIASTPVERKAPEGMQYDPSGNLVEIPGYTAMKMKIAAAGRAPSAPSNPNLVQVVGPDGKPTYLPATQAIGKTPFNKESDKPLTEGQGKAAGFADRMAAAESVMSDPKLADNQKPEVTSSILRNIPSFGIGEVVGNTVESSGRQRVKQAQENWVRANLRLESGAAIGAGEMQAEIDNYFPKLGDSPEVIKQKAESRIVAQQAVARQAGSTYKGSNGADLQSAAQAELKRRGM